MASIKNIEENILQLSSFIDDMEGALQKDPSNFAYKLSIKNYKSQIETLRKDLRFENLKREKEVLQIRLIGHEAKHGSIPLMTIGGITDTFSKSILDTSKHLQFGKRGGKKVNEIIKSTIDLRLEGIGAGSAILFISAKTSPDLFGESVSQRSIENFIGFISSSSPDELIDKIPNVGSASVKSYSSFFKKLHDDKFEIEISWNSPTEKKVEWKGNKDAILSLYNTLNGIKLQSPESIEFEGEITIISIRGKIEFFSKEKFRYLCNYPANLLEIIKELHIGQYCSVKILKTIISNPVTGTQKFEYNLMEVSPLT